MVVVVVVVAEALIINFLEALEALVEVGQLGDLELQESL
tara:strand:+ start:91 stop:207 length:117 start_codon:yes stop_codon:yes gene_type:complete